MPDNIPISPGQGAVIATDQDLVSGAHYQRVKLMDGAEGSSDPIVSDGKSSVRVRTADEDLLKDGNASVKVINDQTQPVPIQLDRYGKALSGNSIPVVLATDHDPVPVTSATLPLLGGAVGANGAVFGPIPLAGCNGVLAQVASSGTLTIIFEATVADPVLGPWVTVSGTRTSNGQIDGNPQLAAVTLAWDFLLSGFAYFRIRVTAYTSGIAQIQVSRYTNAQDPTPSVVAHGMGPSSAPMAVAVDASGRVYVIGGAALAAAAAGNPVFVAGADGTASGLIRQATATPDNTPLNGQTTNQPTMLLIGGADGIFTVSPSYAAPNPNAVGTARVLLTDNTGTLQVADSSITLLRQELRETNALLLLILQALAGTDMVTGKDGLMPHQLPVQ
jgi:hypothetical protein